jgi:N-acetylmuramoyl-L-alanine amidase
MRTRNIALVIGHDWVRKGAYSKFIGYTEYDYNLEVAKLTGLDYFTHTPHPSYRQKMRNTYRKLSEYDLTLELHFNAASPQANGVESLYFHTNQKGKDYADLFCLLIHNEYGSRNRRAKPLSNSNQRGYWAVASGIPTGLILEPFFGSHIESKKFECKERYAKVIREFAERTGY